MGIHERTVRDVEELLKQLLEGQNKLFKEVQSLNEGQNKLSKDVQSLNEGQNKLSADVHNLSERIENLEGQAMENTGIIKAIQHNTEVVGAKVDGLTVNTANKEAVANLDAKFDLLNNRLFQQEADLQRLKKAQ